MARNSLQIIKYSSLFHFLTGKKKSPSWEICYQRKHWSDKNATKLKPKSNLWQNIFHIFFGHFASFFRKDGDIGGRVFSSFFRFALGKISRPENR
jgi:hypothetical protein